MEINFKFRHFAYKPLSHLQASQTGNNGLRGGGDWLNIILQIV